MTEHCFFIQVVKNIIHSRYWMSFSDHCLVCLTHVYAYSCLLCSSFWHHYDRAYPLRVGPSTFSIMSAFNGLTLNRDKCKIGLPKVQFMGHVLSHHGIGPAADKVKAAAETRELENASEVKSFLGLVNFVARYIPDMSFIHSFIHSGHFYSAPSNRLLLRSAPDYSTDTVSEFHAEAHRQLQVKDLPKVPTWRLERESNPRPSG